jgi:hypothetical protein
MVVVTEQLQPVLIVSPASFCRKSNLMFTASAGFKVMQVQLVFSPVIPLHSSTSPPVFFYGEFFKFSGQHRANVDSNDVFTPAPNVDMFLLHHHFRTGSTTHVGSVAMAIADVFQNNGISVGRNLAKILKIFEKIDEAKSRGVIQGT